MLLTITILISVLVAINFLLLKFSSNKVIKAPKKNTKPIVFKPALTLKQNPQIGIKQVSEKLAPTGS